MPQDHFFWSDIPQHNHKTGRRELLPHPFLMPHQQVDMFWSHCELTDADIMGLPTNAELRTEEGKLALLRVYIDGVDVAGRSRKGSKKVWVFMWTPLGHCRELHARRVITVLLDLRSCRCGCAGRCTRNAIWERCAWSFAALRRGVHPDRGPSGEPLTGSWAARAGKAMQGRGKVAHLGADLEGLVEATGARRWNHSQAPCLWCNASLAAIHNYAAPGEPLRRQDWDEAKAQSQITVVLDQALAEQLQEHLAYSTHPNGPRGRALKANVGVLRARDRLEQVPGHDIAVDLSTLPEGTAVHFFRPDPAGRLTHWFPLFFNTDYDDQPILEPERIVGDMLHTVDGRVCQYAGGAIFALLVEHAVPALGVPRHRSRLVLEQRAIVVLRRKLREFYQSDGRNLEQMSHITLRNLVGADMTNPVIDAKAMQSRMLFYFAHWLLHGTQDTIGQHAPALVERAGGLLRSADHLKAWLVAVLSHGPVMPGNVAVSCLTLAIKHVVAWRKYAGAQLKPKHHAFVELSRALPRMGNPTHFSTYLDESINSMVCRLARSVHPANFALEVMVKYALGRSLSLDPF